MKNSAETLLKRQQMRRHWKQVTDPNSFPRDIQKKCIDCNELKPCHWTSSFTQTGKPEYRNRCQVCYNKYLSKLSKARRNRRTTQAIVRRQKRKRRCVDYLGGACVRCGYDQCLKALAFHHKPGFIKDFEIAQHLDDAWIKVEKELDKCELLCSNCHHEEHCSRDRERRDELAEPLTINCNSH